ncbi:MAG: hypothetical protein KC609_21365 [Myxococcales bacterium]|nr:hypothetical protein [Myxococcales bacterium]
MKRFPFDSAIVTRIVGLCVLALVSVGCPSSHTVVDDDTSIITPDTTTTFDTAPQPDTVTSFDTTPPTDLVIGGDTSQPVPEYSVRKLQLAESSTVCPPLGTSQEPPLQELGQVEVRNVIVTAPIHSASSDGTLERFYVADKSGGAWSGIAVVMPAGLIAVNVGDELTIKGTLQEAFCFTQIKLNSGDDVTLIATGQEVPEALTVNCEEMRDKSLAEAYEGVLVRVFGVTVDSVLASFGQLTMTDGCVVDDDFKPFGDELPLVGSEYNSVSGVVRYTFNAYVIEPRDGDDLSLKGIVVEPTNDADDASDDDAFDVEGDAIEDDGDATPPEDIFDFVLVDVSSDVVFADGVTDTASDTNADDANGEDTSVSDIPDSNVSDVQDSSVPDVQDTSTPDTNVSDVQDTNAPDTSDVSTPDTVTPTQVCGTFFLPLINEVRYDTAGQDDDSKLSFVELVGPPNKDVAQTGVSRLVQLDGNSGSIVFEVALGLQKFGSNGILLLIDSDHQYPPNSWPAETSVLYICSQAQCDAGASGCTCIKRTDGVNTSLSGFKNISGLQNGDDCLALATPTGLVFDSLCYTSIANKGTWKASNPELYWYGSPDWATILSEGLNGQLPHQESTSSALGRLGCSDTANDYLDFVPTLPTPGTFNAPF